MKALRFVSIALFLAFFIIGVALLFFVDPSDEWVHQWANTGELAFQLLSSFRFSDHWNCIAMTFFGSISVIVLCVNDILIRKVVTRFIAVDQLSYWPGGLLWLAKSIGNAGIFLAELICLCYAISVTYASPLIVQPADIKKGKYTVLLLGTSKYIRGTDQINRYYSERLNACYRLYSNGVIGELIISGDRASSTYDETADMFHDLQKLGMHGIVVSLEPRGYRTFDSIRRIRGRNFGSRGLELLIVSQYFHLQRALFLAKAEKINALGVLAEGSLTFKMLERELLAKTRVLLDIYIFNTQTRGVSERPRRLVDPTSPSDVCLLGFVLSSVAIAGRMMRILLDF